MKAAATLRRRRALLADDAIAACALRRIEAGVGALDQFRRRFARRELGHADGNGDRAQNVAGGFLHELLAFHMPRIWLARLTRMFERRLAQDDGEFLAAIARGGVAAFDVLRQAIATSRNT